jgi:diguanylate cyclase (GGDEF)-like protein/PAS domain S-box-containing protein
MTHVDESPINQGADAATPCGASAADISYRDLVGGSAHASLIHVDGLVVYYNAAAARLFGIDGDQALGRPMLDFVHPDHREAVRARVERAMRAGGHIPPAEETLLRDDGTVFVAETIAAPFLVGAKMGVHAICWDVTRRARREAQLAHRAEHDSLTGLLARSSLMSRLQSAIGSCAPDRSVALLVADMDGFKSVNDTHGHLAGDEVLIELGRRLDAAVREGDAVGRFGGDEFLVVACGLRDSAEAEEMVARVESAVSQPMTLAGGAVIQLSVSIGSSLFQPAPLPADPEHTALEMLRTADLLALRQKAVRRSRRRQAPAHPLHG